MMWLTLQHHVHEGLEAAVVTLKVIAEIVPQGRPVIQMLHEPILR